MSNKTLYSSNEASPISAVGGKGAHLQKLVAWKARVAPFFIIGTAANGVISEEIKAEILAFISLHKKIVFRSSMIGEDNLDASFAGLFETVLDVEEHNWKESLERIYASLNSSRVQNYISQKNITLELKMAVVVQKQIDVAKSGVLFSRAPVAPTSAVAIDAARGMGEGVVSGLVEVDHYLISRMGELIQGAENEVLTGPEIELLLKESLRLEKEFGLPADIEWGFASDKLYIFQIRPITRAFAPLKFIADTNLSESYPGVVSPFTASFVKRAYENVFIEAAKILGYEGKRLEEIKEHCSQLIISVDDHLYYNLEHYYAVLRSLPGGEKNIENWHKMIGGKMEGVEVPYHDTTLSPLEFGTSIFNIAKLSLKKSRAYAEFLNDLESFSEEINQDVANLKNSKQTLQYLCHLVDRPLGFGITIVNDFYIMLGLGRLSVALKKKDLSEDLLIDLLKTTHCLDSVKPLEAFEELLNLLTEGFIKEFETIKTPAGFDPYEEAFNHLKGKWPEETLNLSKFLDEYGDRSFEELKLESLPLNNDPALLKKLIRWGKENKSTDQPIKNNTRQEVKLSALDKRILSFTRSSIEFRETTRLWRGRFYHFLRQLIIKLAQQMMNEKPEYKNYQLRDFFSLSYKEWKAYLDQEITDEDVRSMMDTRNWQTKTQTFPEFSCWSEEEALLHPNQIFNQKINIKGKGVSPGIVEGRALVLENPIEILGSFNEDFILVTKNTDPAWVYIMSRSKGLVSEKGSMLSHTAIIGRELGLPTLVGVKAATQQIKTGDLLRINGSTGEVEIL